MDIKLLNKYLSKSFNNQFEIKDLEDTDVLPIIDEIILSKLMYLILFFSKSLKVRLIYNRLSSFTN